MPRCVRLFALLIAAALAAGAGRAHTALPVGAAASCAVATMHEAPRQVATPLLAWRVRPAVLDGPGTGVRTPGIFPAALVRRAEGAAASLALHEGLAYPALAFSLGTPYPNPFTDTATLTYTLDQPSNVRLELFDALGQRVAVIEDEARPAGEYRVRFNGSTLPPGLYIIRLTAGDQMATRRLVRGS